MSGQGQTLVLVVSQRDAQCLYDHIGTMPWAEGSWSNNLRSALSEALHAAAQKGLREDADIPGLWSLIDAYARASVAYLALADDGHGLAQATAELSAAIARQVEEAERATRLTGALEEAREFVRVAKFMFEGITPTAPTAGQINAWIHERDIVLRHIEAALAPVSAPGRGQEELRSQLAAEAPDRPARSSTG